MCTSYICQLVWPTLIMFFKSKLLIVGAGCYALSGLISEPAWCSTTEQDDPHLTIVQKKKESLRVQSDKQLLSDIEAKSPSALDALQKDPSITILHEGSGLAPSRVMLQGLGGARIGFGLESLILDDGSFGYFDPSSLPLFKANVAQFESTSPFGGPPTLLLSFADRPQSGFCGSFGAGSFASWLGTLSADLSKHDYQIQSAFFMGGSRGDFSYQEPSGETRQRSNNDHQRVSISGKFQAAKSRSVFTTLLFASHHQGGSPGPMMAPTPRDRTSDSLVAGELRIESRLNRAWALSTALQARHHQMKNYRRPAEHSSQHHFSKSRASTGFKFDYAGSVESHVALDFFSNIAVGPEVDFLEFDGGAFLQSALFLPGKRPIRFFFESTLQGISSSEFVPSARLTSEAFLLKELLLQAAIGHRVRRPSFLEKYFDFGVIRKSPWLASEVIDEVQLGIKALPVPSWELNAEALLSRIENAIFYDQVDFWHIAPINMQPLVRLVLDARTQWQIRPWLRSSVGIQYINAKFVDSIKTVPYVAPLNAVGTLDLGYTDSVYCSLSVRYRPAVTSNLFGGLENPAYAMASMRLRLPLAKGLALLFSLSNFTDVTVARDLFEYPLPGLEVFSALEFFT
jgi:hypothetical protein